MNHLGFCQTRDRNVPILEYYSINLVVKGVISSYYFLQKL